MSADKVGRRLKTLDLGNRAVFPEVVLLKIISHLSIQELARVRGVCKLWNNVVRSDVLWKKFVPKHFVVHSRPTAHRTVVKMWKSSTTIGNERWYPNPLPELLRYESRLRKAEFHNYYRRNSTVTLFMRLNPVYKFTTKGKDIEDAKMNEVCEEIWEKFKEVKDNPLEFKSHEDVIKYAKFIPREKAMEIILNTLEPKYWFLRTLGMAARELNEEGDLVNVSPGEPDDEVEEDGLGDISLCTDDDSVFGSFGDSGAWRTKVNKRLPVHLYRQIKALFADNSQHFIEYFLSDGCVNENFQYGYFMLISDTAVFYIKQFYDL